MPDDERSQRGYRRHKQGLGPTAWNLHGTEISGFHTTFGVDGPVRPHYVVSVGSGGSRLRMKREAGGNPALPRSGMWKRTCHCTGTPVPGSGGLGGRPAPSLSTSPKTCRQPREAHRAVPATESPGGDRLATQGRATFRSRRLRRRFPILRSTRPALPARDRPPRAS